MSSFEVILVFSRQSFVVFVYNLQYLYYRCYRWCTIIKQGDNVAKYWVSPFVDLLFCIHWNVKQIKMCTIEGHMKRKILGSKLLEIVLLVVLINSKTWDQEETHCSKRIAIILITWRFLIRYIENKDLECIRNAQNTTFIVLKC